MNDHGPFCAHCAAQGYRIRFRWKYAHCKLCGLTAPDLSDRARYTGRRVCPMWLCGQGCRDFKYGSWCGKGDHPFELQPSNICREFAAQGTCAVSQRHDGKCPFIHILPGQASCRTVADPTSWAALPSTDAPSFWDDNSADPCTNNADEMVVAALNNINFLHSLCQAATRIALCFPVHNEQLMDMTRTIARAFPPPPAQIDDSDDAVDACVPDDPTMTLSDDEQPRLFRRDAFLRANLLEIDFCP